MVRSEDQSSTLPGRTQGALILAMLTAGYALNFLDRQIINILAESIKRDLVISDAQLGLLTGTAFGLFYAVMGIPIARLTDRANRVNVLAAAIFVWSSFTALCGFATNFLQLFLARLGVGVAEAGGSPASQALLSDYFPHERRATALAVFSMGLPIGTALGFAIGGVLDAQIGWRWALVVAAVPGILLAILIKLYLREPRRGAADGLSEDTLEQLAFWPTVRVLLATRSFLYAVVGGSSAIFVTYVCNAWLPPFFIRLHDVAVADIGLWIGLSVMTGGTIGVVGGGVLVDRLRPHMQAPEAWVPAVATTIAALALVGILLAESLGTAIAFMVAFYTFGTVWLGPTNAVVQGVAPVRARALATGVQLLIGNIVSLAIGPVLVGWLSDSFGRTHGEEGLRMALLIVPALGVVGSAFYLLTIRHLVADRSKR